VDEATGNDYSVNRDVWIVGCFLHPLIESRCVFRIAYFVLREEEEIRNPKYAKRAFSP
jgi:hypothetical protein